MSSYITVNTFGLNIPAGQNTFYQDIVDSWCDEIDSFIGLGFGEQAMVKNYKVSNCSASYLSVGAWNSTGLVVSKIRNGQTTVLNTGIDFEYDLGSIGRVIGLDFGCLGQLCKCDMISISGNYGLGNVPNFVDVELTKLFKQYLQYDTLITNSKTGVPTYLTEEKSRNMTRKQTVDHKFLSQIADVYLGNMSIMDVANLKKILWNYKLQVNTFAVPLTDCQC